MRAIAILALLVGCATPPAQAPEDLGQLALFLFEHFEDTDRGPLDAGWANLAGFLDREADRGDPADRAVSLPVLAGRHLGGLTLPDGADPDRQVAVAVSGRSRYPVADQVALAIDPVQTCLESALTVWAGRTFLTDVGCFGSGSCDRLETLTEVRRELPPLLQVWFDQPKTYRRFQIELGGAPRPILAGRAWIAQRFVGDAGGTSMDQLFHLDVYVGQGDETLRWFAMWSSVSGLVVGRDAYANLVVDGLQEALQFSEEYLGDLPPSCPHDRDAPKPDREP